MGNLQQLKTKTERNRIVYDPEVGMRISAPVLEHVCKKMIEIILFCLPHTSRGTIYTVGPITDLRVIRVATGRGSEEHDKIRWDAITRSDYDYPGKIWEEYRDRPGGVLEAMAWCVERQKSWTSDDPKQNVRSLRKQLEDKAGKDYHHMEPVLIRKTDLWDAMPPPEAYPEDSQGIPIWQESPSATVAVIKIHFLPGTVKQGDRSTRIIKELSRSLGTEMLSLHAREVALEKQKRLAEEREETCNIIAHELRNLMPRIGFAYRAVNNEIAYLRKSWEDLLHQHLPDQANKRTILQKLNDTLQNLKMESNCTDVDTAIARLSRYQGQLIESCLLPYQNEKWFQQKIKPLWLWILSKIDLPSTKQNNIEGLLEKLKESFHEGMNKELRDKIKEIPEDLKTKWVDLAYREINGRTDGTIKEYIELLDNEDLDLPRKRYALRNFIYLKALVEFIPETEKKLNQRLELLKNSS